MVYYGDAMKHNIIIVKQIMVLNCWSAMMVGTFLSLNAIYLNFNHKTGTLVSSPRILVLSTFKVTHSV